MKTYKVTYNHYALPSMRGRIVGTMQGENEAEALKAWNAAQTPGGRINPFYLKFEEVQQ